VNVAWNDIYTIEVRVASAGYGGTCHVEFPKSRQTVRFTVPSTGGWQNGVTLRRGGVALHAGQQTLRVVMDRNAPRSLFVGNLNYLVIHAAPSFPHFGRFPDRLLSVDGALEVGAGCRD